MGGYLQLNTLTSVVISIDRYDVSQYNCETVDSGSNERFSRHCRLDG